MSEEVVEQKGEEISDLDAVLNYSRFGGMKSIFKELDPSSKDPDAISNDEDRVDPTEHEESEGDPASEENEENEENEEEEESEEQGEEEGEEEEKDKEEIEEGEEEKESDESKTEIELLKEQNKALIQQLEEISSKIFSNQGQSGENSPPEASSFEFVNEEDFQDVFSSSENLNKVLNETVQKSISLVVRDLPRVINTEVMKTLEVQNKISKFYNENPDLANHSQYLGHISTEIAQKEPGLTLDENLRKTAEEFRRRTGVKESKAAKTKPSQKKLRPNVVQAPAGTSRTSVGKSSKIDAMQEEIQSVLAFARRPFS